MKKRIVNIYIGTLHSFHTPPPTAEFSMRKFIDNFLKQVFNNVSNVICHVYSMSERY